MHKVFDPAAPSAPEISFDEFMKVDLRVGTVLSAEPLEGVRKPAYKLEIDFGSGVGRRKSSAQITDRYRTEGLVGRRVAAVVNFPPKQVGKHMSAALVLDFPDKDGNIVLIAPDGDVPDGARPS